MRADRRHKQIAPETETLLTEGKVAEAVRVVRETEGVSLRKARAALDAHIASEPLLGVQLDAQRREIRRKFFYVFLLVDAIIAGRHLLFFLPR